jgi:hypothetical protein
MKLVLVFLLLCVTELGFASEAPSTVHAMVAAGSELRPAKDVNGDFNNQTLQNYAFGLGYQSFVFIFETAKYTTWTGNNTLSVSTTYQNYMLWGNWRFDQWKMISPYLAAGVGAYNKSVSTVLSGISRDDKSPEKFLSGVGFGLSLDVPVLWLSVEARAFLGDQLDSQPTLGAMARIGLWF